MLKIIRWNIGVIISLFHWDQAFCYNPTLLDSNADSFNECIWKKTSIPIQSIQKNLEFLNQDDEAYAEAYNKKNVFLQYQEKIDFSSNETIKEFFYNCREIYNTNDDIDPVTQAAAQMIFERVFYR